MKSAEVIDFINEIERTIPVDEWKIGGVHLWPLLRIKLMYALDDLTFDQKLKEERLENFRCAGKLREYARQMNFFSDIIAYCFDWRSNDSPRRLSDAIFLSQSVCRFFLLGGGKYDVWIDPLISRLHSTNFTTFCMETAFNNEYRTPRFHPTMLIEPYLRMIRIKSQLMRPRWPSEVLRGYSSFLNEIRDKVIDVMGFDLGILLKQFNSMLLMADFFEEIFKRIKPKIGFLVEYYSAVGMAFVLACRRANVPSCDLQHGVINEYHCAYSRWLRIPVGGYELLPTMFWTWGKDEKSVIDNWHLSLSPGDNMVLTGSNFLMEDFKSGKNKFFQESRREVERLKDAHPMRVHVLLTLASGQKIPKMILNVMKQSSEFIFWWVRLHPGMLSEKRMILNQLCQCDSEAWDLENASSLPLYALLSSIDIHVTLFSSVVIEAEQFGVPSIILTELGKRYFQDYIQRGDAHVACSQESLESLIGSLSRKQKKKEMIDMAAGGQQALNKIFSIIRGGD